MCVSVCNPGCIHHINDVKDAINSRVAMGYGGGSVLSADLIPIG